MQQGKGQLVVAAVIGAIACPMLCGGSFGMMMGEGPQANGRISQPAWQMPVAFFFGITALLGLALAVKAVSLIRTDGNALTALTVLRIVALYPLAAGLAILVAGYMRARDASAGEGIPFMALGLLLMYAGFAMIRTRRSVFEPD